MSTTWEALHARNHVVQAIVERAEAGDTDTPWEGISGVWDHFDDEAHVLAELHRRWFTTLTSCLDNALETGENLLEDVRRAYRTAARRRAAIRRVLDRHTDHPALVPLVRHERALLARTAGVADAALVIEAAGVVSLPTQRHGRLVRWLLSPAS